MDVPSWEKVTPPFAFWDEIYADMLHVLDSSAENVTAALREEGLYVYSNPPPCFMYRHLPLDLPLDRFWLVACDDRWEETLLIVQSDNGGVGAQGNNYPLRGSKMTPWEGGTRVM